MSALTDQADSVYRDKVNPNNPDSADHNPPKAEIRDLWRDVDAALVALGENVQGGLLSFPTIAAMEATNPGTVGTTANVEEDDNLYRWEGPDADDWVLIGPNPNARLADLEAEDVTINARIDEVETDLEALDDRVDLIEPVADLVIDVPLTIEIEGVGPCVEIHVDADDRPYKAITTDVKEYNLEDGNWVPVISENFVNTVDVSLEGIGLCAEIHTDANDRPYKAIRNDGAEFSLVNGVWALAGSGGGGGGAVAEAYLAGTAYTHLYGYARGITNSDRLMHYPADFENIIFCIVRKGQSLGMGSNPAAGNVTFNGSIAGTTLTVSGSPSGTIEIGLRLFGTDVEDGTLIVSGAGSSWEVSESQTVALTSITATDTARTTEVEHPNQVLMFGVEDEDYGLLVVPSTVEVDRFVDAVESVQADFDEESGGTKETGLVACANRLVDLFKARCGVDISVLVFAAASGGTPMRGHKRGSTNAKNAVRLLEKATAIAAQKGKRLVVLCTDFVGGESDNAQGVGVDEWAEQLSSLQREDDVDFRAITGQSEPVRLIANQCNRRSDGPTEDCRAPWGTLRAMDRNPYVTCCGPIYWGSADGTRSHGSSWLYLQEGVLKAHIMADMLFDVGYVPLYVTKAWRSGVNKLTLRFSRPIDIDVNNQIDGTADDVSTNHGYLIAGATITGAALVGGGKPSGTLTFNTAGTPGHTITIGQGYTIKLVASGAAGREVNIGASAAETGQNVKDHINADPIGTQVTATGASDVLTVTSRFRRRNSMMPTTTTGGTASWDNPTMTGGGYAYALELTVSGTPTAPDLYYASYSAAANMGNITGPRGKIHGAVPWGAARDDRVAGGLVELFDWACTQTITVQGA